MIPKQVMNSGATNINDLPMEPMLMGGIPTGNNNNIRIEKSIDQPQNLIYDPNISLDLPNRDIPLDTSRITQDVQIMPNYIPPDLGKSDFVKVHENTLAFAKEEAHRRQNKIDTMEVVYNEIQTPLLLMIMYFLFDLPIFRKTLFKLGPFLFHSDGNMNIYGITVKSFIFGFFFYILYRILNYFGSPL